MEWIELTLAAIFAVGLIIREIGHILKNRRLQEIGSNLKKTSDEASKYKQNYEDASLVIENMVTVIEENRGKADVEKLIKSIKKMGEGVAASEGTVEDKTRMFVKEHTDD